MAISERISQLEQEKRRLDTEIRDYPTPIPRCDAQFNALFERRDAIIRELEALREKLAEH
jgi:chromosome segregation ATPase